jgi:hypothetical protein
MSVYKGYETRRDLTILAVNAQDETKLARKTEGRFRRADVETACARNNKKCGDREGRNGRIEEEEKESPTGGDLLSVIVTEPICQRTFLAA